MYNRNHNLISDSPNEDKGYNRSHRQTEGGYDAYARGEMPLSLWKTKKVFFNEIARAFRKAVEKNNPTAKHIGSILRNEDKFTLKPLIKLTIKEMKNKFLELRGTHYTGNYYRYTKFYGISETKLLKFLKEECELKSIQLHLDLVETRGKWYN